MVVNNSRVATVAMHSIPTEVAMVETVVATVAMQVEILTVVETPMVVETPTEVATPTEVVTHSEELEDRIADLREVTAAVAELMLTIGQFSLEACHSARRSMKSQISSKERD